MDADKALTTTADTSLVTRDLPFTDHHPLFVYLAGLTSARSRRVMRDSLDAVSEVMTGERNAALVNWPAVQYQHVVALRSALLETYAPASVNRMLSAVRGVLKASWRLGYVTAEQYQRAADVENVKAKRLPAGRELSAGEIGALMANCADDPRPQGARDGAMIGLLYGCGLRRAEAVALDLADYDAEARTLRVWGKGRQERTAFLPGGAARALADWLAIRGDGPGPLFCAVDKAGTLHPGRLTPQAVYRMLRRRGKAAGVGTFTPHDLRRSFCSHLLTAGVDLATVSRLAGHARTETTVRYDRRGDAALRNASERLHVPYSRSERPRQETLTLG